MYSQIGGMGPGAGMPSGSPAPQLPPGVAPMAAMFGRSLPSAQMPNPAASPMGDSQRLGILSMLQQRNPALLAQLQTRFPMLGNGGIPPAFGMGVFPGNQRRMRPYGGS